MTVTQPDTVDARVATLRYLELDPNKPAVRALVAVAQRYDLDPLLGEVQLIQTKNGVKVYISRDGLLAIAHRSGQLDGITVDEQRRNTTDDGWTCYVSVWRKDMSHPFKYGAQCKDNEPQARVGNGPEMALARAERRALRRAFAIVSDESFDPEDEPEPYDAPVVGSVQFVEGAGPNPDEGDPPAAAPAEVSSAPALPAPSAYDTWPLKQITDELRRRNLVAAGTKADLIQRLIDHDTTGTDPDLEQPF